MTTTNQAMRPTTDAADDGAVIVEFSLVFILFITLLSGIISYGMLFALQQSLTHASSEAARASIGFDGSDPTSAQQAADNAEAIATTQLSWLGGFTTSLEIDATTHRCAYDTNLYCLTVVVQYPWRDNPVVPSLIPVGSPQKIGSTSTVQLDS